MFNEEGVKNPSAKTIRRLGLPPNRSATSKKYYRGAIAAKPHNNSNTATLGEVHCNAHQCATRVRYALEMSSRFREYITLFSNDDKAKLNIG